jgi:hypothetical protein
MLHGNLLLKFIITTKYTKPTPYFITFTHYLNNNKLLTSIIVKVTVKINKITNYMRFYYDEYTFNS